MRTMGCHIVLFVVAGILACAAPVPPKVLARESSVSATAWLRITVLAGRDVVLIDPLQRRCASDKGSADRIPGCQRWDDIAFRPQARDQNWHNTNIFLMGPMTGRYVLRAVSSKTGISVTVDGGRDTSFCGGTDADTTRAEVMHEWSIEWSGEDSGDSCRVTMVRKLP